MSDYDNVGIDPLDIQTERLRITRPLKALAETNQLIPYEQPNSAPAITSETQPSITLPNGVQFTYITGQRNTIRDICFLDAPELRNLSRNYQLGLSQDNVYALLAFLQLH